MEVDRAEQRPYRSNCGLVVTRTKIHTNIHMCRSRGGCVAKKERELVLECSVRHDIACPSSISVDGLMAVAHKTHVPGLIWICI
jgi:hypothetical protein